MELAEELAWFQAPPRLRLDLLVVTRAPKLQDSLRCCLQYPPPPSSSNTPTLHHFAILLSLLPIVRVALPALAGLESGAAGGASDGACPYYLPPHTGDFVDVSGAQ